MTASAVAAALWREVTGEPCPREITVHGAEPVLDGPFLVGTAAATCVGVATAAAAEYHAARDGDAGTVTVDMAHAAVSFHSEAHVSVAGQDLGAPWAGLSGDYRTADGWVRLHCNYPHHADVVRGVFGVRDREGLAAAVAGWSAQDAEDAVVGAGGAAAMLRTRDAWRQHPQGQALATLPLVDLRRGADAAPAGPRQGARPLSGVRVLDLTHVIAGPVCGRVLAAHGAEVLRVDAEHRPALTRLLVDTGFGKRSTFVDLRTADGRAALERLVGGADVLVQSYRPGALAARGFGAERLAALRPGIVTVDLNAYGWAGPWALRRGFDSLVQMSAGIANEGAVTAGVTEPRPLPVQALDHGTGWLAAFAIMVALRRQLAEGGSWHLRLALARTAWWLDALGRKDSTAAADIDVTRYLGTNGPVRHVTVPGTIEGAAPFWAHGPHPRGADPARWLDQPARR